MTGVAIEALKLFLPQFYQADSAPVEIESLLNCFNEKRFDYHTYVLSSAWLLVIGNLFCLAPVVAIASTSLSYGITPEIDMDRHIPLFYSRELAIHSLFKLAFRLVIFLCRKCLLRCCNINNAPLLLNSARTIATKPFPIPP